MKRWSPVVALVMLLTTWELLHVSSRGEPVSLKRPFSEFPLSIADRWEGKELGLEQSVLDVLKLTDYMMRAYVKKQDESAAVPVWLYVAYYQQQTGPSYHSPKHCLPGAGWQFVETEEVTVQVQGKRTITINKVLVQKGLDHRVILYWYHDRGRVIASENWAKGYMVWDAMMKHRTDGALVRLSVPVTRTPDEAYQHALTFLQDLWPLLNKYMPPGEEMTQ